MEATPLGPRPDLVDTARILEATWRARRGSAAEPAKFRRRAGERRAKETRTEGEREEEEGRRRKREAAAAAAEAMAVGVGEAVGLILEREREKERIFKKEGIVVGNGDIAYR